MAEEAVGDEVIADGAKTPNLDENIVDEQEDAPGLMVPRPTFDDEPSEQPDHPEVTQDEMSESVPPTKTESPFGDSVPTKLEVKKSKSSNYHYRQSYVPSRKSYYEYQTEPGKFIARLDNDAAFQKAMQVQPSETAIYNNQKYENPVVDPYKKAIEYLEKHNIVQIFQSLTSSVIYEMPEAPLSVMVDHLRSLKTHSKTTSPVPNEN